MNNKTLITGITGALIIITIILICISFCSCEKENSPNIHNGTYYGTIEYKLSGIKEETQARRIISDNTEGTTKIHWWDAPVVDCYTVIENNEYLITNVEILSEPYCNGVKQKNKLLFKGKGKFIGDSLIEEGIVYHFTNIGSTFENTESGTWRACFKKFK